MDDMGAEVRVGTFICKSPLAERIGAASAMQGCLEAVAVRFSQRFPQNVESWGPHAWPHVRFEVNNAMTLVASGLAFVVALEDSGLAALTDDDGRYALDVPLRRADYRLRSSHPGYNAESATARAPSPSPCSRRAGASSAAWRP